MSLLVFSASFAAAKSTIQPAILAMGEHSLILVSLGTCRSPFLGTHALLLFLLSLSPPIPATDGQMLYTFEMTTLARLPFRLGLGRVMDAIVYLQDS